MRIILFALFLLPLCVACSGEISHDLVAVVGDGGNTVPITIRLVPGPGSEYIRLLPYAGISTQQSIKTALEYSREKSSSEFSGCDVLVDFGELPYGEYLDGPSAGAAVAVISYALFENLSIREDAVITGSVDSYGNVGSVGGLYEKAKASVEIGADYFITPYTTIYESLTLDRVEERYGIKVLEVKNIDEVINFMIYNEPVPERNYTIYEPRLSENVTPIYDEELLPLRGTATRMIEMENWTLREMPSSAESWIGDYFRDGISEQLEIINRGYYFTAANDAFLNYIEISTINAVLGETIDIDQKKQEIAVCLDSLERPEVTDDNFQWAVASDLRKLWAEDKLNSTFGSENGLIEEEYATYHELMHADAWCYVSGMLADTASDIGGERINESAWKELADRKIAEAEAMQHTQDTSARLALAKKAYSEGYYGAAIYDSVYVTSMDGVDLDLLLVPADELENITVELSDEERTSVWGKIYHSQGLFFMRENSPSIATSYRLFVYAANLDDATDEMAGLMQKEEETAPPELPFELLVLIFIFFSFVLLYILPKKRRSYADRNKGTYDPGRTGKKSNRAGAEKDLSGAGKPKRSGRRSG